MVELDISEVVLKTLIEQWTQRLQALSHHLQETFGYSSHSPIKVDRLFIAQMADGNVKTHNIGGMYLRKWVLREGLLQLVPIDYAYDEMYVLTENGETYLSPSFLFCVENDEALLSERYGPNLKHRLHGQIQIDREPQIVWATVWKTCVDRGGCL